MNHTLVRLLGWRGAVLNGDPFVFDRWKWLSGKLGKGPLRTLDAGCGTGCFSLYAASQGNHVVGIDFGGVHIKKASARAQLLELPHLTFREADLRKLDEYVDSLGQFDQIISFEVIEHLQDDDRLMKSLARLLKPGGKLILTTPYKHYKPLWGDKLSEVEDGGHVRWGYTHAEMRALMEKHGLQVQEEEYISGVVSQKLVNLTRRTSQVSSVVAWGVTFPLRVLQAIDEPLTKATHTPYGCIAVVATKR